MAKNRFELPSLKELEKKVLKLHEKHMGMKNEREKYKAEIKKRDVELTHLEEKTKKYLRERKLIREKIEPILKELDELGVR